jgi:hypothetical protein
MNFSIKRFDLLPVLRVQLVDPAGTPANLTGSPVVFNMASLEGVPKVARGAVTVIDAATGVVEYFWADGDTDTAALFLAEFEVTYGGKPMTYPNNEFFRVLVVSDLG